MKFDLSDIKQSTKLILPEKPIIELAEETGLHIGDGSMNFYKNGNTSKGLYSLRGHMFDDKEHYNNKIIDLYKKVYDLKIKPKEMPSTKVFGFQIWDDSLIEFKNKILKLPLGKKFDICIPSCFLNRKEYTINVVKGIFDTDGTLYLQPKYKKLYPRLEISTTSKPLGLQLNNLINKLGIRSTIYSYKHKNHNWLDLYKVSIRGEFMLNKWMKIISPNNPKHWKKYYYFRNNS
ncbi:MAG: LAGLIDADG family homing endonuclease [Candidatus Nanoarchaeia archaeon]|nr:LAGLIDADG family homing endonuclease [Candidatus Nanoarchaeia archaeon]MDD5587752.1 LAGLIDADG family homing endonuclease [Candidatus Nanoarchaeia archaeon]